MTTTIAPQATIARQFRGTTATYKVTIDGYDATVWLDYGAHTVYVGGILFDAEGDTVTEYDGAERLIGYCEPCMLCIVLNVMLPSHAMPCPQLGCECTCED